MNQNKLSVDVFETSANGSKLKRITEFLPGSGGASVKLLPGHQFQTIIGFGGSFTEASPYLLNQLSKKNRDLILEAYFGPEGAGYSLTLTHINSCDFSLGHYSYAPVKGDKNLEHFSIDEDRNDIIPMIRDAMTYSEDGFRIIASPWTAPPWMKDNNDWRGGKSSRSHGKHLIQSEACVDAQVPRWQDDKWYWSEEATDWGWDWAPADQKKLHPIFRSVRLWPKSGLSLY